MHTSSYWLTIPSPVMAALPFSGDDRRDGVVGLAFAMRNIAQLLLMCDRHDIGLSVDGGTLERSPRTSALSNASADTASALAADPNIFIYDNYPGGIGFSRPLFEMHALAARAHARAHRRLPLRIGLSVLRRAGRQHRSARQGRRVTDPRRSAPLAAPRCQTLTRPRFPTASDMDLKSRLRAIVQSPATKPDGRSRGEGGPKPVRELTYEPDIGGYEAGPTIDRVGEILGGRAARNDFGQCLVIDRRYESDRWHGDVRISECEVGDVGCLGVLDPGLASSDLMGQHFSMRLGPHPQTLSRGDFPPSLKLRRTSRSLGGGWRAALGPQALSRSYCVHRSRDDRPQRRRGHRRVPRRLRILRPRRVSGPAVPADQLLGRARAPHRRRGVLRRCGVDRQLQRQDVRRAGDGDALAIPSHGDAARGCPALRCAAHGTPVVEAARGGSGGRRAAACRRWSARCSMCGGSATCLDSRSPRASSSSCARAIPVRSSRCSSTTGWIWSRSPPSRRARCGWSRRAPTDVQTVRRPLPSAGSTSVPASSIAPKAATGARRRAIRSR